MEKTAPEIGKIVLPSAAFVIIVMGLAPPWVVFGSPTSNYPGVAFPLGYHPIFWAPFMGSIDVERLVLQCVIVIVTAAALIYTWPTLSDLYRRAIDGRKK
ncbi:MAG TPA: hypothetical protein VGF56_12405 [Rhizomicrobium sp.]|jgi:hypothetical protein